MEFFYDLIFAKGLNKRAKKVFCKTKMAQSYINKKGITNTKVVGVGLDTEKYSNENPIAPETEKILDIMYGNVSLLYVGAISERKNVRLLIDAFNKIKEDNKYPDVKLFLVGTGSSSYIEKCKKALNDYAKDSVIWVEFIDNAQLKFVYEQADIFLLPSVQEIFGMVLLEAMYFGLPVISSACAGGRQLINDYFEIEEKRKVIYNEEKIKEKSNGIIVEDFKVENWASKIEFLLSNTKIANALGEKAKDTIKNEYMWDNVVERMHIL